MPWQETTKMQERMMLITRLEQGDSMASLCREFGISRKTGHKFLNRYRTEGVKGLEDFRRRPYTNPLRVKRMFVDLLVELKKEKPDWGSKKIRELFKRKYPEFPLPARSTVHLILDRAGLVERRHRRRLFLQASPTHLKPSQKPNDLWCIDFKGQFRTQDRRYCYPLTVTDHHSRYLLGCEALQNTKADPVFTVFQEIFEEYGLPQRIRSDNGTPLPQRALWA